MEVLKPFSSLAEYQGTDEEGRRVVEKYQLQLPLQVSLVAWSLTECRIGPLSQFPHPTERKKEVLEGWMCRFRYRRFHGP